MRKVEKTKPKMSMKKLLFRVTTVVAAAYLVVSFVGGQFQVAAKRGELQELDAQLEKQVATNKELVRMMESGDDEAYVERVAREKLGYARPQERVFVDLTGE